MKIARFDLSLSIDYSIALSDKGLYHSRYNFVVCLKVILSLRQIDSFVVKDGCYSLSLLYDISFVVKVGCYSLSLLYDIIFLK